MLLPHSVPPSVETLPRPLSDWVRPRYDQKEAPVAGTKVRRGLDFATQDYLALAGHPALRAAAMTSLGRHRLLAPASALQPDLSPPVLALQDRMARFLHLSDALVFTSGSEAIRKTLSALLRPGDQVIIDAGAHSAMVEAVIAARACPHVSPSGSVGAVERRLRRLSRQPRRGRLFVAVTAIAAFTSVAAELAELVSLATCHDARLVVDASHDLGAIAQGGRGLMETQGCLGQIDVVLGSFAKCFGAPGGYAAFRDPALADDLRNSRRSTPLSPVLGAAILAGLELIDSAEGRRRRRRLHGNALRLRNHLMADGLKVLGQPSAFVPVPVPPLTALPRTALLHSAGPDVPLLMAPQVAGRLPRWHIQLSSDHSPADIDDLAELIRDVTRAFDRHRRGAPARSPTTA